MKQFYFKKLICAVILFGSFYVQAQKKVVQPYSPSKANDLELNRQAFEKFLSSHPFYTAEHLNKQQLKAIPKKDRPDLAKQQDFLMTLDPSLGTVPRERALNAFLYAKQKLAQKTPIPGVSWTERGPNNVGGRTRALIFDPNDASNKKVWAGGVAGGLWFINDITNSTSSWQKVNDFWANMVITCLVADPSNPQIFYAGTGEGYFNSDAVRGDGIWKTSNGGTTWTQLPATIPGNVPSNFDFPYVNKIVVSSTGVVFAATRGEYTNRGGIMRSTDGGTTWTKILAPLDDGTLSSPFSDYACDIEIASNGDLYAAFGIYSPGYIFRSTDNGNNWTDISPNNSGQRIELAVAPSSSSSTATTIIYAVAHGGNGDNDVQWFKKSTNGGASWSDITIPKLLDDGTTHFTRGQAFYDLIIRVNPTNPNNVIVGGIDLHKSTDGGTTWTGISHWYGGFGKPEVHADQHNITYRPGSNSEIIFGNDGGVYYSPDAGSSMTPSFSMRNNNYNVTQFYACAAKNENASPYFLTGAQDNGSQQFTTGGINSTNEVSGGDGAFCHIDQDNSYIQLTAYTFNTIYRSLDGGSTFPQMVNDQSKGKFINPSDYDNAANILYAAGNENTLIRYSGINSSVTITNISITELNNTKISHIRANANSSNRIFIGSDGGRVLRIDNANGSPTVTRIDNGSTPITAIGTVSGIDVGMSDNTIIVTYSNYGVKSVWLTTDGGSTWTSKDEASYGLPDMPVRWVLFNPNNTSQVLLATEVGVWSTDNIYASNPDWQPTNANLANVRCDMLQFRSADKLVTVATHGRGLYTSDVFSSAAVEFSANKTLAYTGVPIQFTDASLKATDWIWWFGDGDSSHSQNPVHTYNNPGKYNVTLNIYGDGAWIYQTKNSYIHVLPTKTPPYLATNGGDFETNPNDFGSQTVSGGLNIWEKGSPANALTTINSGTQVWKTDLDADITKGTYKCALQTPNYNMSASGTYSLRFRKSMEFWYNNAPFGVQIQYSLDKGNSWTRLGTDADPNGTNWYERGPSSAVKINSDIFQDQIGWLGASNNAQTGYNISFLAGNSDVAFRFLLSVANGYQQVGYDVDGFMVDDFEIDYINCNNFTLPFSQSFENAVFPPACWATFRGANGLGTTKDWVRNDTLAKTGSACASVKFENVTGGTAQDWLVTPKIPLSSGKNTLSFWQRQGFGQNYGTNYSIKISTTSQTDPAAFTNVTTYGESTFSTTFTQKIIDLNAYNGQSVFIAFVMEQDDGDSWYIDDIKVSGTTITGINVPEMASIDDSVIAYMEKYNFKGLSVTLAKDGKIVYSKGFGNADLNFTEPTQTYHMARIGSISKPITALAVMKLVQNGVLNLTDKAFGSNGILNDAYFSSANTTDSRIYDITIEHLLTHTAGFDRSVNCTSSNPATPYTWNWDGCEPWVWPLHVTNTLGEPNPITRKAIVKYSIQKGLQFTPGTKWVYSNVAWSILAEIIEKKTGLSYEQYVKTNILDAIGICDTKVGQTFLSEKFEREFEYHPCGGTSFSYLGTGNIVPFQYGGWSESSMDAFGGWISSSPDLVKLIFSVDDNSNKPDILSSAIRASMFTETGLGGNYGKGWGVYGSYPSFFGHQGLQCGQSSGFFKKDNYAWAIITNEMVQNQDMMNPPYNWLNSITTFPIHDLGLSPTQNSSNLSFSNVTSNSVTLNWTNGNGAKRLIAVHKDTTGNSFPVDGKDYASNTIFGQGADLGSNNFVVYNGTSNSVTVTNLLPNTKYYFRVFDYNQNANTGNNALYKVCDCGIKEVVTSGPSPVVAFTANQTTIPAGGSINFTDQSTNTPTSWQWTFNGGTPSSSTQKNPSAIVYNTAGTYSVTLVATNSSGSGTLTKTDYITVNATNATTTVTNVSCNGGSDGAVLLSVSGSTNNSSFTYSWSNGATTQSITNVAANTYTVTITPVGGGSAITKTATVQQPAVIGITVSKLTQVSCNGGNNGAVEITVSGGTSPYTYKWSNNALTQNISALSSGTYTVTVTDNKNCTATSSSTVGQPQALIVSVASQTSATCGQNNGSININVSGGTSPYTYSWSNGATTQNVTGLSGGNFSVTVTDSKGCTATKSTSVAQSGSLAASIASVTNVSCNGGSNGAVNISVSGGTTPYTYSWSNSAVTQNIANISAGAYSVTVTDNSGCSFNLSATVSQPAAISVSVASKTDVSCSGGSNGSINLSVSGGTTPYSYLWSNNAITKDLSGLQAGTYTVTVTATGGCTATASATINQPAAISVSMKAQTNVTCFGGNNGSIQLLVSGGSTPYTYIWSSGAVTKDISNLTVGTYNLTVTDASGCQNNSFTSIITQPSLLSLSITSQTNVSCFGGSNGAININTNGGITPYSYTWDNKLTGQNQTGLVAGNYNVTVTDTNGCIKTASAIISEPALALKTSLLYIDSNNTGISNVTCNGGANGGANVTTTGGTTPYTYLWSNGSTSQNLSNVVAGSYTLTITDSKGCTASITDANNNTVTVTISQPAPTIISSVATDVSCNAGNNGAIDITVTGGGSPFTYNWSNNATSQDISGLVYGQYYITVTANGGCVTTKLVTINQPALLDVSIASITDNTSCGSNNGAVTINVSGGKTPYTYLWSNGTTTKDLSNVGTGEFIVTVTDANACTKSKSATVSGAGALSVSAVTVNVSCSGGNNGSIDITVAGGTAPYIYSWSNGPSTEDISALDTGNYSLTVTDAGSCVSVFSKEITQPNQISVSSSQTNVFCNGCSNGSASLSVTGGTPAFTYLWSNGGTQSQVSNLSAQTYTATVTDSKGCTANKSVTISQPAQLTGTVNVVNVSCNGGNNGSAGIQVSGGTSPYSYLWSNSATTGSIIGLTPGSYAVTITDATSCVATATGIISQPSVLAVTVDSIKNTSCSSNSGGGIYISPGGGVSPYTFNWSGPNNTTSTDEDLTNLASGAYTVTVSDSKGCSVQKTSTVIQPGAPVVTIANKKNASCFGASNGSIDLNVTGGAAPYSYLWSNSAITSTLNGLSAGTYSVTVSGSNGCSSVNPGIIITQPTALTLSLLNKTDVLCNGSSTGSISVSASGGTSPYSFLWSNGNTTSSINNILAGNYSVTVSDSAGCTSTQNNAISQPAALAVSVTSQTNATCGNNDGAVTISVSGGVSPYTYLWSNGAATSSLTGLVAGNYSTTITDNNGCKKDTTITITQPGTLAASFSITSPSCNGSSNGALDLTASGGSTPYSFKWSTSANSEDINGLSAGTYSVTITDATGCKYVGSAQVAEPAVLNANVASITHVNCSGGNNGAISLSVSGGSTPYSFLWNNGATAATQSGLNAGNYAVTVSDVNGCSKTVSTIVNEPPVFSSSVINQSNPSCFGSNDGSITLGVTGGTTPYSYLWSNGSTTASITGLAAGAYSVTVTSAGGCNSNSSATLSQPQAISINLKTQTNVSCYGANNGSLSVGFSGGVSPYSFNWSNGATSPDINNLTAGQYTLTITDSKGCTSQFTKTITQPTELNPVFATVGSPNCNGGNDGYITLTVNGGTTPYTFLWSNGSVTQNISGLTAGNYSVTVTDANGCVKNKNVTLTQPLPVSVSINKTDPSCFGGNNGSANAVVNSGSSPFTYQWTGGATTSSITGLAAGNYSVTVTTSVGCTGNSSVAVTQPAAMLAVIDSSINTTCGSNVGSAYASASGGTSPYTYLWSNGVSLATVTGITAGLYIITVSDANLCSDSESVTIDQGSTLLASISGQTNVICYGGNNGSASVTATGGSTPYSYLWNNNATTASLSGLSAGTYSLTVTDALTCQYQLTALITEPGSIFPTVTISGNISCSGYSDGALTVTANGGATPYSYNWSSGATTATATGLGAGNYSVTVTDVSGCTAITNQTLQDAQIFSAGISGKINVNCYGTNTGSMSVSIVGGNSPYTYSWNNSSTTSSISSLSIGNYSVTVTGSGGCSATASDSITQPSEISISSTVTNVSSNGGNDGAINVTVSGGVSPYSFNWSNNNNTEDLSSLEAGNYSLTITDANGCSKISTITVTQPSNVSFCTGTATLTSPSDTFSDGSGISLYGNNADCFWLIQPANASSITVTFNSFATENNGDYVLIYDGPDTNATYYGSYSGNSLPFSLTSTGGSMLIRFMSNESVTDSGWTASYTSVIPVSYCSGSTTLTTSSGSFDDGSGTNNYSENSSCSWLIQPSGAASITLNFLDFSTEGGYDLVNVYDGNSSGAPQIGSFSGSNIPSSLTSSGGEMFVEFISDESVNEAGWSANYTSSSSPVTSCSGNTTLTSLSGNFSDGSGANNYGSGSDCSWLIQPSGANSITLSFTSFNTETGNDFVNVYDGADTNATMLGSFSGTSNPGTIVSSGGSLFVWFYSNSSINSSGWSAYYSADTASAGSQCTGLSVLSANSGTFSDGSGLADYSENTNCKWLIQPAGSTYITLNFSEFSTEDGYDYVYVYEGTDSTGTLLGSFTGATLPGSLTAIGSSMFVQFISDYTVNSAGWSASYEGFTGTPSFCQMNNLLAAQSGAFSDGSGTSYYLDNTSCSWLIQPPGATTITLWFDSFNTEAGFDYIVVFDGPDNTGDTLMLWTGDTLPASVASTGGSMYIEFISDNITTASGWEAQYLAAFGSVTPFCSGITDLTAPSDTFSDGSGNNNYAINSDCKWYIHPSGVTMITLNFTEFSLEPGYDFVNVYQGSDSTGTLVGSFTGNALPASVTVPDSNLFVHFISDNYIDDAGWSANYTTSSSSSFCNGTTTLTDSSGSFSDGSSQNEYLANSNCSWLIQPAGATSIMIDFPEFATESGYDFVYVYEGSNESGTMLGSFSGNNLPGSISANGGSMFVSFVSDGSVNDSGWTANFTAGFSTSAYCSGTTTLNASSGSFSDGSGSQNYRENSDCSWLIQPPGAIAITLGFDSFSTESGYDFVNIYQGSDANSPLAASYSGSNIPDSITIAGGIIFVQFTSDGSVNDQGWDAWYNLSTDTTILPSGCSGTTTMTAPAGSFSDGSGTSDYASNADCRWLIQPPGATSITINFISLSTEQDYDFVTIYDGTTTADAVLGSFSGNTLPSSVTSTGGNMLVHFTSDASINDTGWEIDYVSDTGIVCNLSLSITANNVSCTGCSDGSADLTVTGATSPVTYLWSNTATTEDISGLAAGTYNVTVTDANSCTTTSSVIIAEPGASATDTINYPLSGTLICSYSNGNNSYGDISKANYFDSYGSNDQIEGILMDFCMAKNTSGTGTATVAIWDNSGTGGQPGTLVATETLNISDVITDITNAQSTWVSFNAPVAISGPFYAGIILPDVTGDSLILVSNSDGDTIPGIAWEQWSDSGWFAFSSTSSWNTNVALAVFPVVSVAQVPCTMTANIIGTDASCNGCSDGSADLTVSGAQGSVTFLWSNAATTEDLSAVGAGTYFVTVTDSAGCSTIDSVTISEPVACTLNATVTGTDATCSGCSDGSADLTVSGAQGSVTFLWSNAAITEDISAVGAGTYYVTVIDTAGCSTVDSVTISEPAACTISSSITGTDATCSGCTDGSADLTVTGASGTVTYLWSNSAITEDISSIAAGTYYVTVTDTAGCSTVDSVVIGEFTGFCSGTTTLTAAADCFSDGSDTSDYLLYSDCKWLIQPAGAASITLTFSAFATEDGYDSVLVYDGATTAAPLLGGFTGGTIPSPVTSTGGSMLVHFISDNLYNDAGWDACYTSATACNLLTIASGTDASCNGCADGAATVSASGGTTPYSYLWSDGQTSATATGLSSGMYYVTVDDAASCTTSDSVFISEPFACNILTLITATDASCNGCSDGSADLTVTGATSPVTYLWSNAAITEDLSAVGAGTYFVTVTDSAGCSANDSVIIGEPAPVPYCSGTTTLTTPTGNFSDGSAASDYVENSDCKWLIQPSGASSITLTFSAFATEQGYDSVYVFDGATTAAPVLGGFTGSTIPSPVTSSGGAMLVWFLSDNLYNDAGWDASYTITTDIVEPDGAVSIAIFPNPNEGIFTYSFKTNNNVEFEANIVNVLGEVIWMDKAKKVKGTYIKEADIRQIPAGVYFLNISVDGRNTVTRIVRE